MHLIKRCIILFLLTALLAAPFQVLATESGVIRTEESPDPMVMTLDLVLVRPLGFLTMLGGTVVFIVSSPFSALGGNIDEAADALVVDPAKFTFQRPLGHFD